MHQFAKKLREKRGILEKIGYIVGLVISAIGGVDLVRKVSRLREIESEAMKYIDFFKSDLGYEPTIEDVKRAIQYYEERGFDFPEVRATLEYKEILTTMWMPVAVILVGLGIIVGILLMKYGKPKIASGKVV